MNNFMFFLKGFDFNKFGCFGDLFFFPSRYFFLLLQSQAPKGPKIPTTFTL